MEFSFQTRRRALDRLRKEEFDVLVIGGGITGAAVARECVSRGLTVALVERHDISHGTSSRSSKLIHGGLRYLEKLQFKLVFEALAERALLLRTAPTMVRPLPFYFPVYRGDRPSRRMLSMGMWLYDLLSLFRAPGFHRSLGREQLLAEIPALKPEGLQGGFRYFDASMWDDVLGVEILRDACQHGAALASYCEAVAPIFDSPPAGPGRLLGFRVRDCESPASSSGPLAGSFPVRARQTIVCAGPWTDELGSRLSKDWKPWLKPSKGVHLVFDLKRIPLPGALVMPHPEDGRISFVIPRPDYGSGVVIVGTTDAPTPSDPDRAEITAEDIDYLLGLLSRTFPTLELGVRDVLSAYIGVRPLMDPRSGGEAQGSRHLQQISREHHIDSGPGGAVLVAGGKYTTHRTMAREIVDFAVQRNEALRSRQSSRFSTESPINPRATFEAIERARLHPKAGAVEKELWQRYGAEALEILSIEQEHPARIESPEGFPRIEAQLRFGIRMGMVLHLEDFYLRRIPLFASRGDHGLPWLDRLAEVWAEELERSTADAESEKQALKNELSARESWRSRVGGSAQKQGASKVSGV
jgi:glycerol-3-phosphate dehydrogenase